MMASTSPSQLLLALLLAVLALSPAAATALSANTVQAVLGGEAVLLMRHTTAPGVGDPDRFRLGDCDTQRNLSAEGRAQAQRIGAALRAAGLGALAVWTSPWCRCQDSARLLGLGTPRVVPALGSFFQGYTEESVQTAATINLLAQAPADPLLLVTHQVNITALTQGAVYPRSGELVAVLRKNPRTVLERWLVE